MTDQNTAWSGRKTGRNREEIPTNAGVPVIWPDDARIDVIGQNGNEGEHYEESK